MLEFVTLACIGLHYHAALIWVGRTWTDTTYESWGFLALLLLAPSLLRPPPRRPIPSRGCLLGILALAGVDLALAPLRLNILSALLGLTSLHLWTLAFRVYRGRWFLHPQLWLALLCLPAVHWANVLLGYHLQHLAGRVAAAGLGLYGIPVVSKGTLLHLPEMVIAVDTTCSGLKLLYAGVLFGLLAGRALDGALAKVLFWSTLFLSLLGTNVVRIISLVMAQRHLGRPVGEILHHGIGLVAFAMACALCLLLLRWLSREGQPSPTCCLAELPAGVST